MIFAASVKELHKDGRIDSIAAQRAWTTAQDFVERRCVTTMRATAAERFIHCLLEYCGRHEHGTRFRDDLKGWRQQAVEKARGFAGFTASAALSFAADFTSRARAGSHRVSASAET